MNEKSNEKAAAKTSKTKINDLATAQWRGQ